ncbi:MAG: hypothetical protein ACPGVD_07250 [Flavobacteriales bacterium]
MEYTFMILMILAFCLNILWYSVKVILKKYGYPVNWFWNHLNDIPNMFKLAKRSDQKNEKRRYYLMIYTLLTGMIAFIVIAFLHFSI